MNAFDEGMQKYMYRMSHWQRKILYRIERVSGWEHALATLEAWT